MFYNAKQKCLLIAVFSIIFTPANVQIAMPMYMPAAIPQPVYAVPAPMPIAVAIQLPERKTTTTSTTTAPSPPNIAIAMAVPVPMPMSVQLAVPAQPPPVFCQGKPRPKACPPCPPCICLPSCTPAFFSYCSPCHQKCRCRHPENAPAPLPPNLPGPAPISAYPVPVPLVPAPVGPPAVVVVPLPPILQRPSVISSSSDETSDSCDSSSDLYNFRNARNLKRKLKRRKHKYRRSAGKGSKSRNTDVVKPVLSYVSENGDVKFEKKLSDKDAMRILNDGSIEADEDSVAVSIGDPKVGRRYNKVLLRDSPTNHVLKKDKSTFIFKPPSNKKINNVAVSFQVT